MRDWQNKDVLIVSPAPCFPRNYGNRLRIFRICERLKAAGARVHFLLYPAEADWRQRLPVEVMREKTAYFHSFHIAPPTRPLHEGATGSHHLKDEWWDPSLGHYLSWLCSVQRFDAAIVNYTWLSRALTHLPESCLKILDTHDQFSGRKELFIANGLEPEFFYTEPAEEAAALARADVVWAIKREEAEFFRGITDRPVFTVPHIDPVTPLPTPPAEFLRIGIIGANNNLNRENFESFLDDAVAHVRTHLTQFELVVAGSVCKVMRPREEKFIHFMGYVDRTEDFYNSVDCVVVPMRFSTGLKIKTAEALSFGKPVVALDHAFEGFHPTHRYHLLQANADILQAVAQLARVPEGLAKLAEASLRSARASEKEVQSGLAQTLATHGAVKSPTFWIVLNPAEAEAAPILVDHALEVADFIKLLLPVGFLLTGPGLPTDDLCDRLAALGRIVRLGLPDDGVDDAALPSLVITAPAAVLQDHRLGAWVMTRHAGNLFADLPSGSLFAAADAMALGLAATAGDMDDAAAQTALTASLLALGQGQTLYAATIAAAHLAALVPQGWQITTGPFLHHGLRAATLRHLREAPVRPGCEDLTDPPGAARPDRHKALAQVNSVLAGIARRGRAASYRLPADQATPLLLEVLLRIGATVDLTDDAGQTAPTLTLDDIGRALRNDAGWARVWLTAKALKSRLDQDAAAASTPDAAAPAKENAAENAAEDAAEAPAENAAGSTAETAGETFPTTTIETAPDPAPEPQADLARPMTPSAPPPTLGFTRLAGSETLIGQDLHFSQLRIYQPSGTGLATLDLQFQNLDLGGRAIPRLVLRFFFTADKVMVSLRRNDNSPDAFVDPGSVWQEDDWGPFLIYNLGERLACAYPQGLAGADLDLLAEVLHTLRHLAGRVGPRLGIDLLEPWGQVIETIAACLLPGEDDPSLPKDPS